MKTILCLGVLLAVGCGGVSATDPKPDAGGAGSSDGQVGAVAGTAGAAGASSQADAATDDGDAGAGGAAGIGSGGAGGSVDPDAGGAAGSGGSGGAAGGAGGVAGPADGGSDASWPACLVVQKTLDYSMAFKPCKDAQGHNLVARDYYCAVCDPAWLQPPQGSAVCTNAYLCVSDCSIGIKGMTICTVQP
jgi:hypothetical protein